MVSGLADVDAITLTMGSLAGASLSISVAVTAIILAAITNTLVKLTIAYALGTREFGIRMTKIFLPTIIAGLAALVFI